MSPAPHFEAQAADMPFCERQHAGLPHADAQQACWQTAVDGMSTNDAHLMDVLPVLNHGVQAWCQHGLWGAKGHL